MIIPNVILAVQTVARLAHEQNNLIKKLLKEEVVEAYEDYNNLPDSMKASNLKGIEFILNKPDVTPEQLHNSWLAEKAANGWVYGETLSHDTKTHPNMRRFIELPESQKLKDEEFLRLVKSVYSV